MSDTGGHAECGARTEADSFGVYMVCDKRASHLGQPHHAYLIGHRKVTEWQWSDDGEPYRVDLWNKEADRD